MMIENNRGLQAAILAVAVAALLLISIILPDRSYSPNENRNLARWPKLQSEALASGQYAENLGDYAADQFAFRDQWITLDYLRDRVLGIRERNGVLIGKDRYLLAEPEAPDAARSA